jgi:hypothetical protein
MSITAEEVSREENEMFESVGIRLTPIQKQCCHHYEVVELSSLANHQKVRLECIRCHLKIRREEKQIIVWGNWEKDGL